MSTKKIGIDIMGVILPKAIETGTFEEFMACSALPDAIQSIKKTVNLYKPENVFIISRCPEFAENGIMRWFDEHNFFVETNFIRSNVYFCREQADKAPIAKRLKLSYFIDDKMSVLDYMEDVVPNRIQLAVESGLKETSNDTSIITLTDWLLVLEYITKN
jgi:hypothetical protein